MLPLISLGGTVSDEMPSLDITMERLIGINRESTPQDGLDPVHRNQTRRQVLIYRPVEHLSLNAFSITFRSE